MPLDVYSIPRAKRKGERGSPCQRPFFAGNGEHGLPLIKIEYEDVDTHSIIQLINKDLKKLHSMETYISYYNP